MSKSKKTLPDELYVEKLDGEWLVYESEQELVESHEGGFEDTYPVGIYQLVQTGKVITGTTFVEDE